MRSKAFAAQSFPSPSKAECVERGSMLRVAFDQSSSRKIIDSRPLVDLEIAYLERRGFCFLKASGTVNAPPASICVPSGR